MLMKIKYLFDLKIDIVHQNLNQLLNHHLNENEYEILLLNDLLNKVKENFDNHNKYMDINHILMMNLNDMYKLNYRINIDDYHQQY
jgi:hypothetical protein